jgi:hypothetical protein
MPIDVYSNLSSGALNGLPVFQSRNRTAFIINVFFLDALRANDFIDSLPEFDGKNLAVTEEARVAHYRSLLRLLTKGKISRGILSCNERHDRIS